MDQAQVTSGARTALKAVRFYVAHNRTAYDSTAQVPTPETRGPFGSPIRVAHC